MDAKSGSEQIIGGGPAVDRAGRSERAVHAARGRPNDARKRGKEELALTIMWNIYEGGSAADELPTLSLLDGWYDQCLVKAVDIITEQRLAS